MKTFLGGSIAATAMLAIVWGCGSSGGGSGYVPKAPPPLKSATVAPGEEASYFPFAKGNQWTFTSEVTQSVNQRQITIPKSEITYKMVDVKTTQDGGKEATCEVYSDDKVIERQIWRIDSKGLYQCAMGKNANRFSTPQLVLPFPPKKGDKFNWSGNVKADTGEQRSATNKGIVDGEQPIDTETGQRYNAMSVESSGTLNSSKLKTQIGSKLYLVPGVGIARYYQEAAGEQQVTDPKAKVKTAQFVIKQLLKLKNFSLVK